MVASKSLHEIWKQFIYYFCRLVVEGRVTNHFSTLVPMGKSEYGGSHKLLDAIVLFWLWSDSVSTRRRIQSQRACSFQRPATRKRFLPPKSATNHRTLFQFQVRLGRQNISPKLTISISSRVCSEGRRSATLEFAQTALFSVMVTASRHQEQVDIPFISWHQRHSGRWE